LCAAGQNNLQVSFAQGVSQAALFYARNRPRGQTPIGAANNTERRLRTQAEIWLRPAYCLFSQHIALINADTSNQNFSNLIYKIISQILQL
jgi:hypothetical protein